MSCAACVASVERVAQAVEGVAELAVNLPLHRGRLRLKEKAAPDTITNVIKAIEGAGFVASVREEQQDSAIIDDEIRTLRNKTLLSLLLALPTLWLSMFANNLGQEYGIEVRF